eukprot:10374717-Lingulodinium_polyedra.AAC.1
MPQIGCERGAGGPREERLGKNGRTAPSKARRPPGPRARGGQTRRGCLRIGEIYRVGMAGKTHRLAQ